MACRAAWPADEESVRHGFHFRRSGGTIRRTNSVNPLPTSRALDDRVIDEAERFYSGFGQRPLFRLTSLDGLSAERLDLRGYVAEGRTLTLRAELGDRHAALGDRAVLADDPHNGWLDARDEVALSDSASFRRMVSLISGDAIFSASTADGAMVSVAYGVIHDGWLVIEAVATQEAYRGRGLGRQTVGAIMGWARRKGVGDAVLQVMGDNQPALALYRSLGFDREMFDYHYRARAMTPL